MEVDGTSEAETLAGTEEDDAIYGLGGDDTLRGNGGNDYLDGGRGIDALYGGFGDDILNSSNFPGLERDSLIDGGPGIDFAYIERAASSASYTFSLGDPAVEQVFDGTTIRSIERVNFSGGSGNDSITGGALADLLSGGRGSDTLRGLGGDDYLEGGPGSDRMFGGSGDDSIYSYDYGDLEDALVDGGSGVDYGVLVRSYVPQAMVFSLADPTVTHVFGSTIIRNIERVLLASGSGRDVLTGGALADILNGNGNDDRLDGGGGDDELFGGAGDDVLVGGSGSDRMTGGTGKDVFLFLGAPAGRDSILDFGAGDFVATTQAIFDSNADGIITFGRDKTLDLGAGSSVGIRDVDGDRVTALQLYGTRTDAGGQQMFLYGLVGQQSPGSLDM